MLILYTGKMGSYKLGIVTIMTNVQYYFTNLKDGVDEEIYDSLPQRLNQSPATVDFLNIPYHKLKLKK
jgi:hypothetical protein